jgi:acetylornithine/succinyldiaminopimelate/putrescine aminotransferase
VFSPDGVYPDPPGLLQSAAEAVGGGGGVVIADEVQGGFARPAAILCQLSAPVRLPPSSAVCSTKT